MSTWPVVIAHRGASGYRPEHTLAAYHLAIRLGADFIEPDLVSTGDGVLVARHENEISATTDVADHPEFASRLATKTVDGRTVTGWFSEDFTLDELKTLRARERMPTLRPRNVRYDGRFPIPTLQEILDLARRASRQTGRTIGVCPETKHPSYFDSIGLSLEQPLVRTLRRNGLHRRSSPVLIQSFEPATLRELATMTRARLVQLVDADVGACGRVDRVSADALTPRGLAGIAEYAFAVGLHKALIISPTDTRDLIDPTDVVADAHAAGMQVHAWTFRAENAFLPPSLRSGSDPAAAGDSIVEFEQFLRLGVDGLFTDQPDLAVAARRDVTAGRAAG